MKNDEELLDEILAFRDCLMIVEGKKDKQALEELNFNYIFVLNEDGKSLYEKIEEIEKVSGERTVCILADFDKKGKQLCLLIKKELSTKKVRMDNSLRSVLLKNHVSHIEGLSSFSRNRT